MSSDSTSEARSRLASQQAALVRSLKTDSPPPQGFDVARLAAAGLSLSNKRANSVRKSWPDLSEALGEQFISRFDEYARHHATPPTKGPFEDGRIFACWLKSRRLLPDAGRLALAAASVRRGFPVRIVRLHESSWLAVVFRVSSHSVRTARLP